MATTQGGDENTFPTLVTDGPTAGDPTLLVWPVLWAEPGPDVPGPDRAEDSHEYRH